MFRAVKPRPDYLGHIDYYSVSENCVCYSNMSCLSKQSNPVLGLKTESPYCTVTKPEDEGITHDEVKASSSLQRL